MELLEKVGLADAADRRLGGYSKGMLQRVGLAQALVQQPRLLVLDEPTEHLDSELADRITARIMEKYRDRALLVITHSGWQGVPQLNLQR